MENNIVLHVYNHLWCDIFGRTNVFPITNSLQIIAEINDHNFRGKIQALSIQLKVMKNIYNI